MVIAAAAGWVLAGGGGQQGAPVAVLGVKSDPPGAVVRANGVELGIAPLRLEAAPRTIVELQARRGTATASAQVTMGEQETLLLALEPSGAPGDEAPANEAGDSAGGQAESVPAVASHRREDAAAIPSSRRTAQPDAAAPRAISSPGGESAGGVGAVPASEPVAPERRRPRTRAGLDNAPAGSSRKRPAEQRGPRATKHGGRSRGVGTLDVFVSPWAEVKVDGRRVGVTPLRAHRLGAGRHRVELYNPELNRRLSRTVRIKAGGTHSIREDWD
jgi:hypothetical protein